MGMSDEQIKRLLKWFVSSSETNKEWSEDRRKAVEENHKWIKPDIIKNMTDDNLEERYLDYYKSGGGRQNLNQIYRDRVIRDKDKFRKMVIYLLDEELNIIKRINEVLSGSYRIEGAGKALITSFLMDFNPDKYCLWNNKTELGISVLGLEMYEAKDSMGNKYLKVLNKLTYLKDIAPELNLSLGDIDLFLHTISAEREGIERVKQLVEGDLPYDEVIKGVLDEDSLTLSKENVEFVMEKYLEEFIESNFDKINFGAELELYQDEENYGRQYQTPIGKIDLLSKDKKNNDFVIIELKKGKSSDIVIGQILRYMGWVKENLAKDKNVRGIIIAKEKDDRIEYALKLMPMVDLYLYNIKFELNRNY